MLVNKQFVKFPLYLSISIPKTNGKTTLLPISEILGVIWGLHQAIAVLILSQGRPLMPEILVQKGNQ